MNVSSIMLICEGLQPPLQPTPTIVTCHATLEALALIQQEMLSFPCYPTLESEAPDLPASDSRRAPWQCSEEDLHGITAASRLHYNKNSTRRDHNRQPSLLNPVIASTFGKEEFSTNQPSGTTSSSTALRISTTNRESENDCTGTALYHDTPPGCMATEYQTNISKRREHRTDPALPEISIAGDGLHARPTFTLYHGLRDYLQYAGLFFKAEFWLSI